MDLDHLARVARKLELGQLLFDALARQDRLALVAALDDGADPNARSMLDARSMLGDHPASRACAQGWAEGLSELLSRGANPDLVDAGGGLAISRAVSFGHEDCLKLLLDHGAKIDWRDADGRGLPALAAFHGQAGALRLLADHGADLGASSLRGETAAMMAAFKGSLPCLAFLDERGVDFEARSLQGLDARDFARLDDGESAPGEALAFVEALLERRRLAAETPAPDQARASPRL